MFTLKNKCNIMIMYYLISIEEVNMQKKIKNLEGKEVSYVTQITVESGKTYILYSDGNLYEEVEGKGFVPLELNEENKKIISSLMERLKPEKTDIVNFDKKAKPRKVIEIEEL